MTKRKSIADDDGQDMQEHEDRRISVRNRSNKLGQGVGISVYSVKSSHVKDINQQSFWLKDVFVNGQYSKTIEDALTHFAMGKVFRPMPNMGKILILVMHHKMIANWLKDNPAPLELIRIIKTVMTDDIAVIGHMEIRYGVDASHFHHRTLICTPLEADATEKMLKEQWGKRG